jgi:c-di-GMP-binding flagellar brake protein YcgR
MFIPGIEVGLEGEGGNVRSSVRGWRTGKYFLIDAPGGAWRKPMGEVVCRFETGGVYYGFATQWLGLLPELNLLMFSYPAPEDVMESRFRADQRYDITLPVAVYRRRVDGGEAVHMDEGVLADLSRGGCRLHCPRVFASGDKVYLKGHLPMGGDTDMVAAFIRRELDYGGKGHAYGLQFALGGGDPAMDRFFARLERYHDGEGRGGGASTDRGESLPVDERCMVMLSGERIITTIRGYNYPKYILIEIPIQKGQPVVAAPGQIYAVRYLVEGTVFSFEAPLLKQYFKPMPLWVFKFPDSVSKTNLRKSQRVRTFVPGALTANGGGAVEGALVDLSDGGGLFMAIGGDAPLAGAKARMRIELPSGETVTDLMCEVKSRADTKGKVALGLAFLDTDSGAYGRLHEFYATCMAAII